MKENKKYQKYFEKQELKEGMYDRSLSMLTKEIFSILSSGDDAALLPENIGRDIGNIIAMQAVRMWGRSPKYKEFVNGIISSI